MPPASRFKNRFQFSLLLLRKVLRTRIQKDTDCTRKITKVCGAGNAFFYCAESRCVERAVCICGNLFHRSQNCNKKDCMAPRLRSRNRIRRDRRNWLALWAGSWIRLCCISGWGGNGGGSRSGGSGGRRRGRCSNNLSVLISPVLSLVW